MSQALRDRWRRLMAQAARQYGLLTRDDLRVAGMTARQVDTRIADGTLRIVHRGVYALGGSASTWEQRVAAACLATRGIASHRSAARLWALRGCDWDIVEVTIIGGRRRELTGVVSHTRSRPGQLDITRHRGIHVTPVPSTLLDLGAVVSRKVVMSAAEDAFRRRLATPASCRRLLGRGRPGAAVLRDILDARGQGAAPTDSTLEDAFVRLLERAGLEPPVRQYQVRAPDGGSLYIDFAFPAARLAIELDSQAWHSSPTDVQRNAAKNNVLVGLGWRILRFTWDDIRHHPERVIATLERQLAA